MDQSTATTIAFAQEVLEIFKDEELQVHRPGYMDNCDHDPHGRIDPYSCDYKSRDTAWVLKTWKEYIRPKYKKALSKWCKETGGDNLQPDNFLNYCGGDTWLAGVYGIDMNAHFILASEASRLLPCDYEEEVVGCVDGEGVEVCGDDD